MAEIELECADVLTAEWADADLVLATSLCFSTALVAPLAQFVSAEKPPLRPPETTLEYFHFKLHQLARRLLPIGILELMALVFALFSVTASAQSLNEVLEVRSATTQQGAASQLRIDEVKDQTSDLLTQYKQVMKVVE